MKSTTLIAGLIIAMTMPLAASAKNILEQRLNDIANRVEGVFTGDKYGHTIKSLKDERDLKTSLLLEHQRKAENLLYQLEQIEIELSNMVPDYDPINYRWVEPSPLASPEVIPFTPPVIAPFPVTSCTLHPDGTIDVCITPE